jgi:LacI family transcriptional regulator
MKRRFKRPPTLDDIAARAGVTKTVVSQVLRDVPGVRFSAATRQRVIDTAKKLNYRPNFFATQIRAPFRKLIALCVDVLDDPFAGAIADAFENEAALQGHLVMGMTPRQADGASLVEQAVGRHGILSLAVVGYSTRVALPDELLVHLARQDVRVVTIGRPAPDPLVAEVTYDNEDGVRQMVERVVRPEMKHVWLMGLGSGPFDPVRAQSVDGLRSQWAAQVMKSMGWKKKIVALACAEAESNFLSGYRATARELASGRRPDAVLCFADQHALGCIHALADAGLTVGRDVAVSGFNDQPMSAYMMPPLSSVRVPVSDLGRHAALIMTSQERPNRSKPIRVMLPATFIPRASTGWRAAGSMRMVR